MSSEQHSDTRGSSERRFEVPNTASRLPDYTNRTQEAILAAFQPGNYQTIQSLGKTEIDNGPFHVGKTGATTFSDFAYVSSPYDLGDAEKIRERLAHGEKVRAIGGEQAFFAGYGASAAGSTLTRMQYDTDADYQYIEDPYDEADKARHAERVASESLRLGRPFMPAGVQKALAKPTRAMLGDAMASLYRTLTEDWTETPPTVLSTAEDLIVVYFSIEKVKNEGGVTLYMNHALNRNDAVREFDLRKIPGAWARRTVDGHLMFTFRPPWVRTPVSVPDDSDLAASQPEKENSREGSR